MQRGLATNRGRDLVVATIYILPLVINSQGQKPHKQSRCLITAPCIIMEEIMVT